jgi:hypothetical protein
MYKKNNSNILRAGFLLILFLNCNYIICSGTFDTIEATSETGKKLWKAIQSISQYGLDRFVYWTKTLSVVTDPRIERVYNALNDGDFAEVEKDIIKKCQVKEYYITTLENRFTKLDNQVSQINNKVTDCKQEASKCLDIVNQCKGFNAEGIEKAGNVLKKIASDEQVQKVIESIKNMKPEVLNKFLENYTNEEAKVAAINRAMNESLVVLKKENEKIPEQIKMINNLLYVTMLVIGLYGLSKVVHCYFFSDNKDQCDKDEYNEDKK